MYERKQLTIQMCFQTNVKLLSDCRNVAIFHNGKQSNSNINIRLRVALKFTTDEEKITETTTK